MVEVLGELKRKEFAPVQKFKFKNIFEFDEEVIRQSNSLIAMAVKITSPHRTISVRKSIDELYGKKTQSN